MPSYTYHEVTATCPKPTSNIYMGTFLKQYYQQNTQELTFLKISPGTRTYQECPRRKIYPLDFLWSPYTDTAIQQIENVQRRTARWFNRGYRRTSSVIAMLQSLQWTSLDRRRLNGLSLIFKITNDFVAISRDQYLTALQKQSRTSHIMAYRQILSSTDYHKQSLPFLIPGELLHIGIPSP